MVLRSSKRRDRPNHRQGDISSKFSFSGGSDTYGVGPTLPRWHTSTRRLPGNNFTPTWRATGHVGSSPRTGPLLLVKGEIDPSDHNRNNPIRWLQLDRYMEEADW